MPEARGLVAPTSFLPVATTPLPSQTVATTGPLHRHPSPSEGTKEQPLAAKCIPHHVLNPCGPVSGMEHLG